MTAPAGATPPHGRATVADRVRDWWRRADDARTGIRWASLATVVGGIVVALVCLVQLLRGRTWAWLPLLVAAAVALREVRYLQRVARGGRRGPRYQENAPR